MSDPNLLYLTNKICLDCSSDLLNKMWINRTIYFHHTKQVITKNIFFMENTMLYYFAHKMNPCRISSSSTFLPSIATIEHLSAITLPSSATIIEPSSATSLPSVWFTLRESYHHEYRQVTACLRLNNKMSIDQMNNSSGNFHTLRIKLSPFKY